MIKTSKQIRQIVLASCGAGILAACATPTPSYAPTPLRNQIKVAESIERLELYARPEGLELSARDQFAVGQFLESYRTGGDGPLYVNLPAGEITGHGTQQANTMLRTMMAQAGINPAALQTGEYQSEADAPSPVVVSYRTLRAVPADCRFMDDLSRTYNNQPSHSDVLKTQIWRRWWPIRVSSWSLIRRLVQTHSAGLSSMTNISKANRLRLSDRRNNPKSLMPNNDL